MSSHEYFDKNDQPYIKITADPNDVYVIEYSTCSEDIPETVITEEYKDALKYVISFLEQLKKQYNED